MQKTDVPRQAQVRILLPPPPPRLPVARITRLAIDNNHPPVPSSPHLLGTSSPWLQTTDSSAVWTQAPLDEEPSTAVRRILRAPEGTGSLRLRQMPQKAYSSYQRQAGASSTPAAPTMRFSHFTQLAALVTLAPAAMADLYIYKETSAATSVVIRCESDGCITGFDMSDIDVLEMDYKE
ncbi:hypothetical protein MGG_16359 [Pyricularia oryzae 70-15]|uniref:Uncharacterized protein n=1 Tax=Pyricularia oryzae (strain 70-15 / ATCC MYA-4617 / FGSC 8958) TaxID=242507 RepID=G4MLE4_PYRO7|nr:uncharacterized protein MGG_16359 [Pyricularia oryzae 70-15]EHA57674.1 hypothetical protein MGG_16359 [Pyricularia oryzae 70-15]